VIGVAVRDKDDLDLRRIQSECAKPGKQLRLDLIRK
jgi:hypothetical protein